MMLIAVRRCRIWNSWSEYHKLTQEKMTGVIGCIASFPDARYIKMCHVDNASTKFQNWCDYVRYKGMQIKEDMVHCWVSQVWVRQNIKSCSYFSYIARKIRNSFRKIPTNVYDLKQLMLVKMISRKIACFCHCCIDNDYRTSDMPQTLKRKATSSTCESANFQLQSSLETLHSWKCCFTTCLSSQWGIS